MIEQQARVTFVEGNRIYVESLQTSACSQCAQKSSCGSAIYASVLPKRQLALTTSLSLKQGDNVVVGLNERDLLRASLLLYLLPVIVMLITVSCFDGSDEITALLAVGSLAASLYCIHRLQAYFIHFFMTAPTIVRKD